MSSTVTARPSTPGPIIDQTTILSLLAALTALVVAYVLSHRLLHPQSSKTIRVLFIWHFFDALIHFLFEGSFLYHCFFTFAPSLSPNVVNPPLTAPGVSFLGRKDRVYGSFYSQSPTAKLWQEYAKADRRWGGADLGVISLELLTVFGAGPIASYVCWLLVNGAGGIGKDASGKKDAKLWFWATVLATGELYGGFMTFAPEWLTGCPNLDTSNFMYMWVYLFFFNMLWVWLPLWILYQAFHSVQRAFVTSSGTVNGTAARRKKDG